MSKKNIYEKSRIIIFIILFITSRDLQSSLEQYFPVLKIILESPAFKSGSIDFTKKEELYSFLKKIEKNSKHVTYKEMKLSQKNETIPYVVISENNIYNKKKPTLWIQAMQHGDEPGSGEAALSLASFFSKGIGGYLENLNIIIVPRLNFSGADKEKASLENNIDLNTDHMLLSTPESKSLKTEVNKYEPEILIDLHEYPADQTAFSNLPGQKISPYYDILIARPNNRNISYSLEQTEKEIIETVKSQLQKKDIRMNYYYSSLKKEGEKITLTMPSSSAKIARNAFALVPTLSILMEGRGKGTGLNFFQRRVGSLVEATVEFSNVFKIKSEKIKTFIIQARKEVAKNEKGEIILITGGSSYEDSYKFINLNEDAVKSYNVVIKTDYSSVGGLKRNKPMGYLIDSNEDKIIEKLEAHGIIYSILDRDKQMVLEEYQFDKDSKTYSLVLEEINIEAGKIIVELNQNQNILIMLLFEPESETSFARNGIISTEKNKIPYKRIMGMSKI